MTALLALLTGTTLAAWPGRLEDFETPKAAILLVGSLAFTAGRISMGRAAWPARLSPLDVAMGALVLATALSTLFSLDPWTSLVGLPTQHEGFVTTVALASLYAAARSTLAAGSDVEAHRLRMRLLYGFLVLGSLVALYALLQVVGLDPVRLEGVATYGEGYRRPSSFLGHANLMGVVTAASGALAVSLLPAARGRRRLLVSSALLAVTLAALLSVSRAAWIGLAGGVVVGGAAALRAGGAGPRVASGRYLLWGATILLGASVVAWLFLGEMLVARLGELFTFGRASGASRFEIWKSAWAAFLAHPLLGTGPDTFAATFRRFQTPDYWRFEWGLIPQHAHSIYLHVLATRGAVGFLALAALAAAFLLALRTAWCRGVSARREAASLLAMATAFALAGAAGAVGIAGAASLALLAALAASLAEEHGESVAGRAADRTSGARPAARPGARRRRKSGREGSRRRAAAISVAVGVVVGIPVARDLSASGAAGSAATALGSSAAAFAPIAAAARAAARAESLAPYRSRYTFLRARALVMAAKRGGDRRIPLAAGALATARRAAIQSPIVAQHHLWRGHAAAILAAAGDSAAVAEMEAAYERAVALAPYDAFALNQIAERWLDAGRALPALEYARRSAQLYPGEAWSLTLQGLALLRLGRRAEGAAMLRRALGAEWRGEVGGRRDVESILERLAVEAGR